MPLASMALLTHAGGRSTSAAGTVAGPRKNRFFRVSIVNASCEMTVGTGLADAREVGS
jgi:hypothetical protein